MKLNKNKSIQRYKNKDIRKSIDNPKRRCNYIELCTKVTITLNSGCQIDLIWH